jgi:hypothetical protein
MTTGDIVTIDWRETSLTTVAYLLLTVNGVEVHRANPPVAFTVGVYQESVQGFVAPSGLAIIRFGGDNGDPVGYWLVPTVAITASVKAITEGLTANATFEAAYGEIIRIHTTVGGQIQYVRNAAGNIASGTATARSDTVKVSYVGLLAAPGTVVSLTVPGYSWTSWVVESGEYEERPGISKIATITIVGLDT